MLTPKQEVEIELLAMKMWETDTGLTYGWGSVVETHEYRKKARSEYLSKNK